MIWVPDEMLMMISDERSGTNDNDDMIKIKKKNLKDDRIKRNKKL